MKSCPLFIINYRYLCHHYCSSGHAVTVSSHTGQNKGQWLGKCGEAAQNESDAVWMCPCHSQVIHFHLSVGAAQMLCMILMHP